MARIRAVAPPPETLAALPVTDERRLVGLSGSWRVWCTWRPIMTATYRRRKGPAGGVDPAARRSIH
jgi:hypothetical protein